MHDKSVHKVINHDIDSAIWPSGIISKNLLRTILVLRCRGFKKSKCPFLIKKYLSAQFSPRRSVLVSEFEFTWTVSISHEG